MKNAKNQYRRDSACFSLIGNFGYSHFEEYITQTGSYIASEGEMRKENETEGSTPTKYSGRNSSGKCSDDKG
jgi:hypothetical protein